MNKYWWMKIEQVSFGCEKNSQIWKLKIQLYLVDSRIIVTYFFIFLL